MRELLETVRAWQAEGATLGRAVVVRTFGSAPRPEGATLAVTADGRLAGSVSGGCVEGAAYEEIQAARAAGVSRVIRYGITDEQAWDVGLACGGTIDVLVEPYLRPEIVEAAGESTGSIVVIPLPADAPPAAFGPYPPGAGEPPAPAREQVPGCPGDRLVRLRQPSRPAEAPVIGDRERGGGRFTGPGWMRPERGCRRVGRQRDHHDGAGALARGLHDLRPEVRLHEHVDRAAAGQTHVPRLLVSDPVAYDAADAGGAGSLDLLVRGAFHAAARDAPGQPPIRRADPGCPLRSGRRTERPDDDGAAERRVLRLPCPDRLEQLPHRSSSSSFSAPAAAPTPGLPASRGPPPAGPRPAAGSSAWVPAGPGPEAPRGARAASPFAAAAQRCPAPSRRGPPRAARARRSTGSAGSRRSTGRRPPCPPRSAGSPRCQRAG